MPPAQTTFSSVLFALVLLQTPQIRAAGDESVAPPSLPRIQIAADQRTFVTAEGKHFVPMGVTYFRPGTGWAPQVWKQFDADKTRGDFARMKSLGVNCVRVFLSYGSFCMAPGVLDTNGLAKFDQFLGIAEEFGIYVHPTGPDHWEGMADWAKTDRIADEQNLLALESFWKLFAARYRGRNGIFAYDLRNEPEVAWDNPVMRKKWNRWLRAKYRSDEALNKTWNIPGETNTIQDAAVPKPTEGSKDRRLLDYQSFREEIADEWTRRQVAAIKAVDPHALVTVGLIQWSVPSLLPGIQHYSGFRPERQAKYLDFLEVHFYPFAEGVYEYGGSEAEWRNLAYLEGVVREVARPGKPVVLAEFGWYGGGKPGFDKGRHPAATEEQQAQWCRHAVETTAGFCTGWLNWGFYDHPGAGDVTELTGLVDHDGKTKAWGRAFEQLAQKYSQQLLPAPTIGPRPDLDWSACLTSSQAAARFRTDYYRAFIADRKLDR